MGDDSIGLRVVEYLESCGMVRGFEAAEAGNNGMQVLTYFREDVEKLVIVDCARVGLKPGEFAWLAPADVQSRKLTGRLSTHEGDIVKLLEFAAALELPLPPVRIMAIQPHSVEPGMALSPALEERLAEYAALAAAEAAA
jgi:hydrogenase maturation protease